VETVKSRTIRGVQLQMESGATGSGVPCSLHVAMAGLVQSVGTGGTRSGLCAVVLSISKWRAKVATLKGARRNGRQVGAKQSQWSKEETACACMW